MFPSTISDGRQVARRAPDVPSGLDTAAKSQPDSGDHFVFACSGHYVLCFIGISENSG